uniref:Small CPxCG-related zinc finger protein n=1 Tax=uncultured virus TaxID=340016 RepID=D5L2K3_9VIRU|nr:hypothetical protein [uncultured virus]
MSERPHRTADEFDEQITHCVHCGAIDQPEHDIRLRLKSETGGYSEIVCNVCVPRDSE